MIKKIFSFLAISLILSSCSEEFKPHVLPLNTYYIYCDSLALDAIHEHFKENIYVDATIEHKQQEKIKLRIRGDSSREYPKKSLKVKITEGLRLFETKKFNFNAEYKDLSFSHSYMSSLVFGNWLPLLYKLLCQTFCKQRLSWFISGNRKYG